MRKHFRFEVGWISIVSTWILNACFPGEHHIDVKTNCLLTDPWCVWENWNSFLPRSSLHFVPKVFRWNVTLRSTTYTCSEKFLINVIPLFSGTTVPLTLSLAVTWQVRQGMGRWQWWIDVRNPNVWSYDTIVDWFWEYIHMLHVHRVTKGWYKLIEVDACEATPQQSCLGLNRFCVQKCTFARCLQQHSPQNACSTEKLWTITTVDGWNPAPVYR